MGDIKSFRPQKRSERQKYYQGYYDPYNPKKYVGSVPIIYRSSWELAFMNICEQNPNVVRWSSESVKIPYFIEKHNKDGVLIKEHHYYYPDFVVEVVSGERFLIEIKPDNQSPKTLKDIKRNPVLYKNAMKWKASITWAKANNYIFKVVTERQLKTNIF